MEKIKILDSTFINDKSKNLSWLNRNYFFVVTVFIVLLNVIIYAVYGSKTGNFTVIPKWDGFSVANLFQALVNSYSHANWQHVLLNMLCFFVAGLYLERKQGSLRFLVFMFVMSLFTAFATSTNDMSLYWGGFSAVNYGLYGYIVLDAVFMICRKESRYAFNVVFGDIVIILIYLAMCFNGGTQSIGFEWYPYDLFHNLGHASGFVVGLVLGVYDIVSSIVHSARKRRTVECADSND